MQGSPVSSTDRIHTLYLSGKDVPPLHAGDVVSAEVVHVGSDKDATIKMGNAVFDVQSDIPLRKGDRLTLRVERQENFVYLRLTGNAVDETGAVKADVAAIAGGFDEKEAGNGGMTRLVELLKLLPVSVRSDLPEVSIIDRFLLQISHMDGRVLKTIVENGGVFFETKLRILALGLESDGINADIEAGRIIANDLKASLLRLKEIFLSSPGIMDSIKNSIRSSDLIDALNVVLRNIEFYQLQSKLTDSLQFFLPLVWKQLRDGEVIIRESDRGKLDTRGYSCTINLDLDGIGKVKVGLVLNAGYIHVNCATENSLFSKILTDGADVLEQRFRASGLRLGNLSFHHVPRIHFTGAGRDGISIRA